MPYYGGQRQRVISSRFGIANKYSSPLWLHLLHLLTRSLCICLPSPVCPCTNSCSTWTGHVLAWTRSKPVSCDPAPAHTRRHCHNPLGSQHYLSLPLVLPYHRPRKMSVRAPPSSHVMLHDVPNEQMAHLVSLSPSPPPAIPSYS